MEKEEVKDVLPHTAILWLRSRGVSIIELAAGTGVNRATLYRILERAESNDFCVRRKVKTAILAYYKRYRELLAEDKRVCDEIRADNTDFLE